MPTTKNKPIESFQTPNTRDIYFVQYVDPRLNYYNSFEYGDLHPRQDKYPGAKLTYRTRIETQEGLEELARMVWCADRHAQDVYNAKIEFSEGDDNFPIYTRRYLELRQTPFVPKAKLGRLPGLMGLKWLAGGSSYQKDSFGHIALIFTGGGASTAATGFGVVVEGVITAVYLTSGGIGYTSAPVVSALGGSGLSVTAVIQSATALLTKEVVQMADGELGNIWDTVIRIYETLPGPVVYTSSGYEDETGAVKRRYEQRVAAGTSEKAFGSEYPASSGFWVINSSLRLDETGVAGTLVTDVMAKPDSRVEYLSENYPVPDVVTIGPFPTYSSPPVDAGCPPGPYQGRTYDLLVHTPAAPKKLTFTYAIPGTSIPFSPVSPTDSSLDTYAVTSQPSRFLPIRRDTIHDAFTLEYDGPTTTVIIEVLTASDPATYVSGSHIIDVEQRQWHGPFDRRIVTTVVFP